MIGSASPFAHVVMGPLRSKTDPPRPGMGRLRSRKGYGILRWAFPGLGGPGKTDKVLCDNLEYLKKIRT